MDKTQIHCLIFKNQQPFIGMTFTPCSWNRKCVTLSLSHSFFTHKEYCSLDAASMIGKANSIVEYAWILLCAHTL